MALRSHFSRRADFATDLDQKRAQRFDASQFLVEQLFSISRQSGVNKGFGFKHKYRINFLEEESQILLTNLRIASQETTSAEATRSMRANAE